MKTMNISSFWKAQKGAVLIAVLVIFYVVGVVGILLPLHQDFVLLTPFNLLLSLGLVLAYHSGSNQKVFWLLAVAYLWGWLIEMIGVNTGLIFGNYQYGPVLGPKILGTPLMIGINWALLIYCAGCWVNQLFPAANKFLKAGLIASLMVFLDLFIEPVAMQLDFWQWENGIIPVQNYIAWFFVALPLAFLFIKLFPKLTNIVAQALFIIQLLFFLTLGIA